VGAVVKVINTLKFKVVNESVKKTDRHDARTIAEFLEKDMLPEARLCSEESEQLRRLLKSRKLLVRTVVSLKNQVHGLLLSYGIETRRGQLQSKKERRRILDVLAEQGLAGQAVEPLLDTIDRVEQEVKKLEKLLIKRVEGDRVVELLMSIPGTGIITAATVRAYVDDINRFSGYKQFSAYAGLAPWVQNSNERERYGSITKRGPEPLRTALVQMVLGMVRNQRLTGTYRLMLHYHAMKPHKGTGKTIIATARKLSKIVWYMLRKDTPFDPIQMTDPQISRIVHEMRAAVIEAA
jgi:transposase